MDIQPKKFKHEYETTFILTPELSEGEHKVTVDKFVKLIKDNDGEVHNIERWGMRRLAYSIERKTNGFYAYVEFGSYGDLLPILEKAYRYDEQVIRYLTVKLDKHALAYNKKRREQGFGLRKDAAKSN